ncbi:MAG TPA: NAD-dependent epimerase/dehydratase family protein [Candidatus Limnocylindria bacterium]|nr:NAD-dependent epimerase/dehydratase family protein [Candidatus Limnocylindria bacterium]
MSTDLVTGAFGYTGSRIAERLLGQGRDVRTMSRRQSTGHALAGRVQAFPAEFDDANLDEALAGVDTVYATYWMRFPRGDETWDEMIANIARLARAARRQGVRRLVYFSVSNARHESTTPYFRAKAHAADHIRAAAGEGLSVAIVRPTLLYGPSDILINNMAWSLRKLPVFGIMGDGRYRVQPVHVNDVADLALRLGAGSDYQDVDAAGPETFTFDELVRVVKSAVGSRSLLIHMPVSVVLATTRLLGVLVRDVVLTRDETRELMESLLVSASEPSGNTPMRFSEWIVANGQTVGRRWSSELGRNFRIRGA